MKNSNKNLVALITGASGDIGRAIAIEYASHGYNLALHYNSDEKSITSLIALLAKYNVKVVAYKADFGSHTEIDKMMSKIGKDFGGVDVLVNNAGKDKKGLIFDEDYDSILDTLKTNTVAPIYLTKLALPQMISNREGRIVNISSIYARFGGSFESVYSASKSAFTGFTSALASELSDANILVNNVAPGAIDTKMNADFNKKEQKEFFARSGVKRMGSPAEVAKIVYFLGSKDNTYINGQTIFVDGGLNLY